MCLACLVSSLSLGAQAVEIHSHSQMVWEAETNGGVCLFLPRSFLLDRAQGSFVNSGRKYLPLSRNRSGSSLSKQG